MTLWHAAMVRWANVGGIAISLILLAALTAPSAQAQGTRADYERANALGRQAGSRVFMGAVRVHEIDGSGNRFWYRNDFPDGRRAFVLVEPEVPRKGPAFDHARLAAALTKALGQAVTAERLPVESIAFDGVPAKTLRLQVREKTFNCDLSTYALQPSSVPLGRASGMAPEAVPSSREGGDETTLTLLNHTGGTVTLLWKDSSGATHDYGTLASGESRALHTYAGHAWIVARADGTRIAGFVATDTPALGVIEPSPLPPPGPQAGRGRRRRNNGDGEISPDRKWRLLIRDHNVVLVDIATGAETLLTRNGSAEDTYEGPLRWSPDSRHCVCLRTIPAQEHKVYLVESSPRDQEQPRLHTIDYLKPGDQIAHPRPCLLDIAAKQAVPIADSLFSNPWDLSDFDWEPDGSAFTFLYNQRGHQVMHLVRVEAATGAVRSVIDEQAKTFIDWTNKVYLHRLPDTHEAIWMSERDGWNHLYRYDTQTGMVKNQITRGPWVVRGIDRVDDDKRQIWFRAGGLVPGQDPYYIHCCRVNFDGTGLTDLTPGDGTHTVVYLPDQRFLVDTYSRVDQPPVSELRRASDGGKVLDLEKGDAGALLKTGWRYPQRFVAKGRDGRTDIYGVLFRPSNFTADRKYPVLENIYAGPQGSFVPKNFSVAHGSQQMAELGFIVVQIDGMGTNNRSKAFHDVCWKNLADSGFPDRIAWMKAAAASVCPQMDLERVGIYGTSAGGQSALSGLLRFGDFYKAGVADCGCHDNRMDKIWWNEQWMGWPVGPEYAANSNVTLAANLKGKLLLMVGEQDTNVDPASTMQVVDALIRADRDFELLVLPGAGHGVAGTPYGRRRLQDFFVRTLLHAEPRAEAKR